MIRHCSLWKFHDGVSADEIDSIVAEFTLAAKEIPSVRGGSFGRDIGYLDSNYDFAINLDFDDLDGYRAYVSHKLHVELYNRLLKPIAETRAAVQFEVTGGVVV